MPRDYEAAKVKLNKKFGGQCCQLAWYMDELERLPSISGFGARDFEKLTDLLEVAVVNLQDTGDH